VDITTILVGRDGPRPNQMHPGECIPGRASRLHYLRLVEGAPTCSRLGCDEAAVAVFGFDARECLVWLDPLGPGGRGAGVLCARHADRMSPPRGWNLLDRRAAESRLWIGRAVSPPPPLAPRTRARPLRTRPCAPTGPRLPFEMVSREADAPARVAEPPREWSPRARPGPDLDRLLDARTPLLARAFESARPVDDE
jgi:Protein of unknown function (DUF3499)